ncbi:hypothetical protein BDQ17DRAFT_1430573 [Cyathus striatus]|nr:hypothetical protein BDQ17DRAFT_1430573 [Cyathus striatus]
MTTSNSDHGKGITTAFSNGTSQTLQNASVLNAGGNITYFNFGDFMQSDDNNSSFVESSKSDVDVEADNRKTLAYKSLSYVLSLLWSSHKEPQEIAKLPSEIPGGSSPIEVTSESYRSEMRRLKSEDNNGTSEEQAVVVISSNEHEFPPLEALLHAPSSYEIYVEKMFPLKYGYPLWLPQPDRNFPIEYRRKGVSIGDVGCISPDDGFESMSPPSSGTTSKELFSYRGMVTSFANVDRELDRNTMDVTYSFNDEDKGSLLYMPVGAFQDDYIEVGQLKSFITKNAESWYRYAIAKCGRVLDRHSLYLVTGCLKSRSWGIVTWDTAIPKRHSTLVIGLSPDPVGPAYEWKRVVNATTFRTGPTSGPTTNTETRLSDTENQCLFVRGYKISLSEEVWNSINEDPQKDEALDKDGNGNADSKNLNTGERRKANFRSNEDTPSEDPPSKFHNKYEVSLTNLSEKPNPLHPLNAINDVLLAQVSGSHVAITHDNEWWTAVEGCHNHGNMQKQDHGFNIQNFQRSLKSQYVIRYDEGTKACTLEPRDIDHTQHDNDKFAFTSVYTEESPNSTEAPPLTVQSSSTSTSSMLGGDSQAKGEYTTAQQKLPSAINFRSLRL